MKKLIISLSVLLFFASCKGPGSGPLVRDSFSKKDKQALSYQHKNSIVTTKKMDLAIEPCEGCITISNLLANKKSFAGKVIKIKGKVTKYNPEIMGKNWVHIQDGTEFEGAFDLAVTTNRKITDDDVITFEGKIVLDKDFGYGYFYTVLMEEGKPVE
jgi:hypothetical protein